MVAMVSRKRQGKNALPDTFSGHKTCQCFCGRGSAPNHILGAYSTIQTPSWIWEGIGGRSRKGMKGKGKIARASCSFATRCHTLKLQSTKFYFGWGSAHTPLRELTALPRLPGWIEGPTSKGRKDETEWQERESGKGRRGSGRELPRIPSCKFSTSPLFICAYDV